MHRETRERWEAEASKRADRAEARDEAAHRREDELKREEAALVSANLELQVRFSEVIMAPGGGRWLVLGLECTCDSAGFVSLYLAAGRPSGRNICR